MNTLPINYFYVFGNAPATSTSGGATNTNEYNAIQPGNYYASGGGAVANVAATTYSQTPVTTGTAYTAFSATNGGAVNGYTIPIGTPVMIQTLNAANGFDPMTNANGVNPTLATLPLYPGVLPGLTGTGSAATLPTNYKSKIPSVASFGTQFVWVCLRRPANPLAPVSATNPMLVVDAMRVPYIDGTGQTIGADAAGNAGTYGTFNTIYSAQRFQPYRGGHAVPVAQNATSANTAVPYPSPPPNAYDTRYGYTEQTVPPSFQNSGRALATQGLYFTNGTVMNPATFPIEHTLGWANEYEMGSGSTSNTTVESWDYLPFHDRDFTSPAELMFVPVTAPGLFTKQFVEFAPSLMNVKTFLYNLTTSPATAVISPQVNPGVPAPGTLVTTTSFTGKYSAPTGGTTGTALPPPPFGTGTAGPSGATLGTAPACSRQRRTHCL